MQKLEQTLLTFESSDATSRSCLRRLQLHVPFYASKNRRIRFVK